MADRIADNADLIVDDMKRKARRRLVGAIVLALAAAIILPMLLEKEPRPLGDDVSVQIPPVDDGKFVNRLSAKPGDPRPAPKANEKADAKSAASRSEPKPESAVGGVSTVPMAPPAVAAPPPGASGDPVPPKKPVAEPDQQAQASTPTPGAKTEGSPIPITEARVEARSAVAEPRPANAESKGAAAESKPAPRVAPAAAATPAKAEGFVVQLAAFADDKGANSLANKLKKVGYLAYVEPVTTSRGTLWRVRVGGYGSRPEADAARAKLKGEGFSGIVAPAT